MRLNTEVNFAFHANGYERGEVRVVDHRDDNGDGNLWVWWVSNDNSNVTFGEIAEDHMPYVVKGRDIRLKAFFMEDLRYWTNND